MFVSFIITVATGQHDARAFTWCGKSAALDDLCELLGDMPVALEQLALEPAPDGLERRAKGWAGQGLIEIPEQLQPHLAPAYRVGSVRAQLVDAAEAQRDA